MNQNKNAQEKFNQLRRQAEELISASGYIPAMAGAEDPMKLIHELATFQIELEMQNDELRLTQEKLEAERSRYFDLYDFAPVGYITLNQQGIILEANLAAADLLGVARSGLIRQRLAGFILEEDQDIHYLHSQTFFTTGEPLKYELRMVNSTGGQFWVQMAVSAVQFDGALSCRMVLSDITERKKIVDTQAFLLTCGLPASGEDFFRSLARYLSKTLDMEYVCIDHLTGDDLTAQTLAVYNNGKFEMNVSYALKNTPCGKVVEDGICCYPEGVQKVFPGDVALQELMAQSYLGTTLIDSKGRQIGLIAVIGRHAMVDPKNAEALLSLVAPRAAGELERRQAEEKLQQFKSIVSGSNDIMALVDTNLRYLAVNNALLDAFGKTRDEIIGHCLSELVDNAFFDKTIKPRAEECMTGVNVRFSLWYNFPAKGRRYMDVEYSPYKSKGGKINGFVIHARDNSDLKKAQTLLEENKLQLEAVLNNINLSIYITGLKTNRLLFMNRYLKQFYSEDLTGRICWKSFHKDRDGPCEFCTKSKLTDAGGNLKKPYVSEFYNEKQNKWYERSDSVIPWIDGSLVHMGITKNITRQKKLQEKQLRIKAILEEKVKMRTAQLEDMNAALRVLLKKREEDRDKIEDKIFANHKLILSPILDVLKKKLAHGDNMDLIALLESELKNIISPFSKKLSDQMINLTPTEIHIADLIKHGKSTKEISTLLDSSVYTIARHRENIRRKIGLKNTKTNLRSFLLSIQ